jgi:hypothetical protein
MTVVRGDNLPEWLTTWKASALKCAYWNRCMRKAREKFRRDRRASERYHPVPIGDRVIQEICDRVAHASAHAGGLTEQEWLALEDWHQTAERIQLRCVEILGILSEYPEVIGRVESSGIPELSADAGEVRFVAACLQLYRKFQGEAQKQFVQQIEQAPNNGSKLVVEINDNGNARSSLEASAWMRPKTA